MATSLTEYQTTTKPAYLLEGPPGTGKTAFGLNFKNVFVLEMDNNLHGPLTYLKRVGIPVSGKFVIPHIEEGKLVPRHQRWLKLLEHTAKAIIDSTVDAIFLDGLTELVAYAMDEVRRQQGLKIGNSDNLDPKIKTPDDPLRIQDWGAFAALLKHFFIQVKSSGKTLILSAHTTTDKDEMSGTVRYFLNCPGSTREVIAGYFDEAYLFSKIEKDGKTVVQISTAPETASFSQLGLKTSGEIQNKTIVDFTKLKEVFAK